MNSFRSNRWLLKAVAIIAGSLAVFFCAWFGGAALIREIDAYQRDLRLQQELRDFGWYHPAKEAVCTRIYDYKRVRGEWPATLSQLYSMGPIEYRDETTHKLQKIGPQELRIVDHHRNGNTGKYSLQLRGHKVQLYLAWP